MKHQFIFIILAFFLYSSISVAQIDDESLLTAATHFLVDKQDSHNARTKDLPRPLVNESGTIFAYVQALSPKGFVVFSPTKDIYPVVAFSFEHDFVFEKKTENVLLNIIEKDMKEQMAFFKTADEIQKNKNTQEWTTLIAGNIDFRDYDVLYGKWLPSTWGGVNCYDEDSLTVYVGNYFTPNHYSPGCVGTSISQIMHYYKWPKTGVGSHTDYDNYGSSQGSYYANFGDTQYDWTHMQDFYKYVASTDETRRAMGKLALHCGISVDMDYENDGSTSNINRSPAALDNYFRFSGHHKTSSWSNFWSRMDENIENGHPIQLAIGGINGTGHAPVCDGYRNNNGDTITERYYHLDMGWWGNNNAWYRLRGSFNAGGYTSVDAAVFDILPDPFMETPTITGQNTFTLQWSIADNFTAEAYELQESYNGGTWTTISNTITTQQHDMTVSGNGTYQYRVRAKSDGHFYLNSYSNITSLEVLQDGEIVTLIFDGDDSFFTNDNSNDDLDVSESWTFEAWVKPYNQTITGEFPVIMDRRTVFSMYLIDDTDADYAIRFVARNGDNISASLRSDNSTQNLNFGEWVHIAAVKDVARDDGFARLYINGVLVDDTNDADFALSASTNAVNFGARYWGSFQHYLVGEMDEIRISNTGRYAADFTPDRDSMFSTDANTILLLHLNENYGMDINDASEHFNNIALRPNPNEPNWTEETLPVVFSKPLEALTTKTTVNLTWTTASETNCKGYEILRSADAKIWQKIGWKMGNGDAATTIDYHFEDTAPMETINYYRLKQIDFNDNYEFSNIAAVVFKKSHQILKVFPNPSSGLITIDVPTKGKIKKATLITPLGQSFQLQQVDDMTFDTGDTPTGVYELMVEMKNGRRLVVALVKL